MCLTLKLATISVEISIPLSLIWTKDLSGSFYMFIIGANKILVIIWQFFVVLSSLLWQSETSQSQLCISYERVQRLQRNSALNFLPQRSNCSRVKVGKLRPMTYVKEILLIILLCLLISPYRHKRDMPITLRHEIRGCLVEGCLLTYTHKLTFLLGWCCGEDLSTKAARMRKKIFNFLKDKKNCFFMLQFVINFCPRAS